MIKEMMMVFTDEFSISWELVLESKEWYILRDLKSGKEHPKKKCFTKEWRRYERSRNG